MFFKSCVGFGLSNCVNAKEIHLECEVHNAAIQRFENVGLLVGGCRQR